MDIKDFDRIELHLERFVLGLSGTEIEKFQITELDQLNNMYIVINRTLAEENWKKAVAERFKRKGKEKCNISSDR